MGISREVLYSEGSSSHMQPKMSLTGTEMDCESVDLFLLPKKFKGTYQVTITISDSKPTVTEKVDIKIVHRRCGAGKEESEAEIEPITWGGTEKNRKCEISIGLPKRKRAKWIIAYKEHPEWALNKFGVQRIGCRKFEDKTPL